MGSRANGSTWLKTCDRLLYTLFSNHESGLLLGFGEIHQSCSKSSSERGRTMGEAFRPLEAVQFIGSSRQGWVQYPCQLIYVCPFSIRATSSTSTRHVGPFRGMTAGCSYPCDPVFGAPRVSQPVFGGFGPPKQIS